MGDYEELLSSGYFITDSHQLSDLDATKKKEFVSFFHLTTTYETLMNPANRDKRLVRLLCPSTGDRREIFTSEPRAIELANKQLQSQNEPVGTTIHIQCVALGGSEPSQRIFYIDNLVASLDGINGWKLVAGEARGTFEGKIRIESVDKTVIRGVLDDFESLLDCLTVLLKVGFHVQHYSIVPIPRCTQLPYWGPTGPIETMLQSVVHKEIETLKAFLSNSDASAAARGLRQAYCESLPASRLWRLWAAAEDTFGTKPEPLLTKEEAKALMACAEGVEGLKGDSDRLKKLKEGLRTLPRVSRNEQIADKIALIMGISVEEADKKVKLASYIRGQHSHKISADVDGVEASERFLHEALRRFIGLSDQVGQ